MQRVCARDEGHGRLEQRAQVERVGHVGNEDVDPREGKRQALERLGDGRDQQIVGPDDEDAVLEQHVVEQLHEHGGVER